MIINHTHRFIFVHIPKAAGTAATNALATFSTYRDLEVGGSTLGEALQKPFFRRFGLRKHSTSADIRQVVGAETWGRYFTFAFTRNPYTRAVSTYRFLREWREWPGSEIMDGFPTVNEFIASDYWQTDGIDSILLPQAAYLTAGVDYIGKVEDYDRCMSEALNRVGLTVPEISIDPFRNASQKGEPEVLNEHSLVQIERRYSADFDLFGFPRQPPPAIPVPRPPPGLTLTGRV